MLSIARPIGLVLLVAAPLAAHPGSGIVVDRQGQVFFADTGCGVWKIDAQRRLIRQSDTKFHWLAADRAGRFKTGRMPTSPSGDFSRIGEDLTLLLSSDLPVAIGDDGALYYPERGRDGSLQLVRWTSDGARSAVATLPGLARGTPLQHVNGLAAGPGGSVYYTENSAVRRVSRNGEVSTIAERVTVPDCAAIPGMGSGSGPYLRGLDVAADGTVYVAAAGCGALLGIDSRGVVTPVLRTVSPWSPTAAAVVGTDVYVLEYLHTSIEDRSAWVPRVRQRRADGTVRVLATVTRGAARIGPSNRKGAAPKDVYSARGAMPCTLQPS